MTAFPNERIRSLCCGETAVKHEHSSRAVGRPIGGKKHWGDDGLGGAPPWKISALRRRDALGSLHCDPTEVVTPTKVALTEEMKTVCHVRRMGFHGVVVGEKRNVATDGPIAA